MKILFKITPTEFWLKIINALRKDFPEHTFVYGSDEAFVKENITDADAVVAGRIYDPELDCAKRLKALFIPFAGLDAFPLKRLSEMGITISNSHAASPYVAERTIALILALLGKVAFFDRDLRRGYWHRGEFWESLWGKTIGIWGVGSIGRKIAQLLKPFNCRIRGVKNSPDALDYFDSVTAFPEEMIQGSDIIISTLPLTPSTEGLISWRYLSLMEYKYFVNVGRGGTVVEKDLWRALEERILKGAALDAWFDYPRGRAQPIMPSAYPFHELDNVVLSPHAASHAEEARQANIVQTAENIRAFVNTGRPTNIVDAVKGY